MNFEAFYSGCQHEPALHELQGLFYLILSGGSFPTSVISSHVCANKNLDEDSKGIFLPEFWSFCVALSSPMLCLYKPDYVGLLNFKLCFYN